MFVLLLEANLLKLLMHRFLKSLQINHLDDNINDKDSRFSDHAAHVHCPCIRSCRCCQWPDNSNTCYMGRCNCTIFLLPCSVLRICCFYWWCIGISKYTFPSTRAIIGIFKMWPDFGCSAYLYLVESPCFWTYIIFTTHLVLSLHLTLILCFLYF